MLDNNELSVSVEIVVDAEVFCRLDGVLGRMVCAVSMVVKPDVEWVFGLSDVLNVALLALQDVYDVTTSAVGVYKEF